MSVCSSVFFFPSTRTVTCVPAPSAAGDATASASVAPPKARIVFLCIRATPFHEGVSALRRLLVSWLTGLPSAPSRRLGVPSGVLADGVPDHSGGSAPDSRRLPITTDLDRRDPIAANRGTPACRGRPGGP